MPIPESFRSVYESLVEQTTASKLKWTEISKWAFLASFDQYALEISDSGGEEEAQYTLSLKNGDGLTIDEVILSRGMQDYDKLQELWLLARRSARDIDGALRHIEDALKSLG